MRPSLIFDAFPAVYKELANTGVRIIIGTYFASVAEHLNLLKNLPVHGVHIDAVRAPESVAVFADAWPENKVLSVGLIDGRNVWRANLSKVIDTLAPVAAKLGNNLWIAPSCSLLHSPQDLAVEESSMPKSNLGWRFAAQKLVELGAVKQALAHGKDSVKEAIAASDAAAADRATKQTDPQRSGAKARGRSAQRRRSAQITICRAHQSAARMDEIADSAHHHHRLFPANHRNPPSARGL